MDTSPTEPPTARPEFIITHFQYPILHYLLRCPGSNMSKISDEGICFSQCYILTMVGIFPSGAKIFVPVKILTGISFDFHSI